MRRPDAACFPGAAQPVNGMMPAEKFADESAAQAANAAPSDARDLRPTRDWGRLVVIHIKVAALAPLVAAASYSLISPDRATLLTWKGFVGSIALVGCTYVFFGAFAIAGVILVSPPLCLASKIRSAWMARVLTMVVAGGVAWLVGGMSDVAAFQIAATLTAILGVLRLEHAWRTTKIN